MMIYRLKHSLILVEQTEHANSQSLMPWSTTNNAQRKGHNTQFLNRGLLMHKHKALP